MKNLLTVELSFACTSKNFILCLRKNNNKSTTLLATNSGMQDNSMGTASTEKTKVSRITFLHNKLMSWKQGCGINYYDNEDCELTPYE